MENLDYYLILFLKIFCPTYIIVFIILFLCITCVDMWTVKETSFIYKNYDKLYNLTCNMFCGLIFVILFWIVTII